MLQGGEGDLDGGPGQVARHLSRPSRSTWSSCTDGRRSAACGSPPWSCSRPSAPDNQDGDGGDEDDYDDLETELDFDDDLDNDDMKTVI